MAILKYLPRYLPLLILKLGRYLGYAKLGRYLYCQQTSRLELAHV